MNAGCCARVRRRLNPTVGATLLFAFGAVTFAGDTDTKPPEIVTVGLYWNGVPSLDLRTNSYTADFYLWFRWRGDIDPTKTFEFTNLIDPTTIMKTAAYQNASGTPEPQVLPNGEKYQAYHVQGRFSQPFSLERFPVDEQQLLISVEDLTYESAEMQYSIDGSDTGANPKVNVPGWLIDGFDYAESTSTYNSRFGDTRVARNLPYSHVTFRLHISRPVSGLICKTVLPISIIILITCGAFFCGPKSLDARLSLTITALIAAVALWYTTGFELPPANYLLLIDKIYILSFLTILSTTLLSVIANRLSRSARPERGETLDRFALPILVVCYFGGIGALLKF